MTATTNYAKLADEIERLAKEKEAIGAIPPTVANHERKLKIGEKLYRSLPDIAASLRDLDAAKAREAQLQGLYARAVAKNFEIVAKNASLTDRLRDGLLRVGIRCSVTTSEDPRMMCTDPGSGRTIDAPYIADRWCNGCIARAALEGQS